MRINHVSIDYHALISLHGPHRYAIIQRDFGHQSFAPTPIFQMHRGYLALSKAVHISLIIRHYLITD